MIRLSDRMPDHHWLIRLRWAAVVGQSLTVVVAILLLDLHLSLWPLLAVVGGEVLFNLLSMALLARGWTPRTWATLGAMVVDVIALTALLALSGGTSNPFNFLYLVHVVLAGVLLGARAAITLLVVSALLFGSLFFVESEHAGHDSTLMAWHLRGMWFAFLAAGSLLVVFIARILGENERQRAELEAAAERERASRVRASLAALAAGAAHELTTPLSTIAVVARDLERTLGEHKDPALGEDARLLREQVRRCESILQDMSAATGRAGAMQEDTFALREICQEAIAVLPRSERVQLVPGEVDLSLLRLPRSLLRRALTALLDNAIAASPEQQPVELRALRQNGLVGFEIADRGPGIPLADRERVREPFYTTKPFGQGLGLGLYLVDSVARDLGGSLQIEGRPGGGALVRLLLPAGDAE